ncbi:carboxypeptidase regulatory-like domain-containing protein [Edaphobacter bradus]|uniref:carboxypeptidase regulatory-like domain-containing protein n=1 Tax=Edaphobacter bradus TaxID=2259016 RepID=UPI0021E0E1DA|nr:carboxypeptidase regulatory-like domain-containing protein [Edaphobacter bradus]
MLIVAIGYFFLAAGQLSAQANRASITGTITDSTGAVVADVEVMAMNVDTNIPTAAVSTGNGIYVIPNLFPGRYALEFKKNGFETLRRSAVTLASTQVARIDASLKVGATSDSVEVTATTPILDLEKPTFGTDMNNDVVNNLPLSIYGGGRSVENFAVALTPGYSPISSPYGAVINGGQWFVKDYTIDGTSGTGDIQGNSMLNGPSMEAVQELQAQTSGLDAQSAITGGGVMSFNLKSGTNQLHGSGFLYGVNELLNANTWNNDNQGLPKDKKRAWDFGGSLGGPIIKNKTFFFGTWERYSQIDRRLGGYSGTVPTAQFLSGNFGALLGPQLCTQSDGSVAPGCGAGTTPVTVLNNAGQSVLLQEGMIFDPVTGNQFTGNAIPANRISSVSQKIIGMYQKHYAPQRADLIANSRFPIGSPSQTSNQAVVKLDHLLTERDRLSGSWTYNRIPRVLVDSGGLWEAGTTDGGPFSTSRNNFFRSHQFRVSESHTFSPTLLNVVNLTYNYDWQGDQTTTPGDWNQQLGFGNTGSKNFPGISFGNDVNGYNETYIGNKSQGDFSGATFIAGDTLTWTKGRHNISLGGDFRARQINSHSGNGALSFGFDNNATGAPSAGYSQFVGFGFASFLLGDVSTASQTTPFNLYGRAKTMSLFAQDSYKITPKLTLSAGLRWDYNFRFHEKYGHWANFDLKAIDPKLGIPGALVFAKDGSDSFEKNEYATNFGPHIGLAYSPWSKVVFRGAFSMIFNPPPVPYFTGVFNGFAPGFQGTNIVGTPFNWDNGYPGVFKPGNKNVDPTTLFPLTSVDPRALRVGYSDAFNLGVQYELTPTMRVEAAYVGNRGHRLSDSSLAYNEGPTSTMLRLAAQNPDLNGFNHYVCSAADAASYGVQYPYTGFCGPLLSAIAPFPQLAQAMSNYWYYPNLLYVGLPSGQSYYDSMVVDVVKHAGGNLTMDTSYTWSRQEGNSWSAQQEGNGFYTAIQDFSHMGQEAHTITGYDITHVVKGFVTYQLPFGKGQYWLKNTNRILNGIVGGWQASGVVLYTSGQPFRVGTQNPLWPQWGNFYPNWNLNGFTGPNDPNKFPSVQSNCLANTPCYMPQSVVSQPAFGQLGKGPMAISQLRCPGGAHEDSSLQKNFSVGPEARLSFRTEFYNLFNRHSYSINGCGGIQATIGAADFGQIYGVNDQPRTGQFAVRLDF